MITTIQPTTLKGTIQAPASKSSMQRACAAALLYGGTVLIKNPGHSNDDRAALGVIKDLGATVTTEADGSLRVVSRGVHPGADAVDCGESGLGIRMFAPIIGSSDRAIRVNGQGSLLTRPMDFFDEIFPQIGIKVKSNGGKLPLELQGPLQPRDITIDGSLSSQFLTGLLFAYAAAGADGVAITVNNLKSKPYIDLTLQVMRQFGWEIENRNYESFHFSVRRPSGDVQTASSPGQADNARGGKYNHAAPGVKHTGSTAPEVHYTVEGDWSGGAFLLVAGAIAGPITVKGLDPCSTQADKAILQALTDAGARLTFSGDEMIIGPGGSAGLKAFSFDATDCPDLFPPLVALAAYCKGVTVIDGVDRLAHKESNRGLTLQDEFAKLGLRIGLEGDRMHVHGGEGLKGATVHSRHDHRIAMACAVAALKATGATVIEEAEAINKSYPDFYDHLQRLGAVVGNKKELI